MGNHNLYDTPEDLAREKKAQELKSAISSVREYLMEFNCSAFSVMELKKLTDPPVGFLTDDDYLRWLLVVKKRIEAGIMGGRHLDRKNSLL